MKSKFSDEELELKVLPTQEEFDKVFLELIEEGKKNIRYINSLHHFSLCNSKNEWLFEINYDSKNTFFLYSYDRIYLFLESKFNIKTNELQLLMCNVLEDTLKLYGITPVKSV